DDPGDEARRGRVLRAGVLRRGVGVIDASSRGAWHTLLGELRPFVARRVRAADVDDVVQDVFLRMQRALPELRDEERFGAWIHTVARSAIADHLRAAARRPHGIEPVLDVAEEDD